jgi:hypothetical protein
MQPELRFHLIVGAAWILIVAGLGIGIAVSSAERTALGRRMGVENETQRQLAAEQSRLRAELDWLASPPALEEAVSRTGVPVVPPPRLAAR